MDIVLERILSLIPRKPDGGFVHGAKKEFAEKLGMSHNLVTMWEKGQSTSYKGKVHEIAAKYDVSVEWLQGKTDEKKPLAKSEERVDMELYNRLKGLSDEERKNIDDYISFILSKRKPNA